MSEASFPACPICHAQNSLSRQSTQTQDRLFIWYECHECASILLQLDDGRWAYQRIGREDKSQFLKRPMTDDELRALVPHTAGDEPTTLPGSDSALDVSQTLPSEVRRRRNWAKVIGVGLLLAFMLVVALKMGFYTIQPIGALPEGRTLIVWRDSGEPFFNSPDAMCMDRIGEVSLLCRGVALTAAPVDRIVLRLPYMDWAYLLSTGGKRFER